MLTKVILKVYFHPLLPSFKRCLECLSILGKALSFFKDAKMLSIFENIVKKFTKSYVFFLDDILSTMI